MVDLLQGLWRDGAWGDYPFSLAMLVGMMLIGGVLSAKTFRWEAKRDAGPRFKASALVGNSVWRQTLAAGVKAAFLSVGAVIFVIGGYAAFLALSTRGNPDPALINQFAGPVGAWVAPALAVAAAFWAAFRLPGRDHIRGAAHGLVIGLIVTGINVLTARIFGETFTFSNLIPFTLPIVAGWLGNFVSQKTGASHPAERK